MFAVQIGPRIHAASVVQHLEVLRAIEQVPQGARREVKLSILAEEYFSTISFVEEPDRKLSCRGSTRHLAKLAGLFVDVSDGVREQRAAATCEIIAMYIFAEYAIKWFYRQLCDKWKVGEDRADLSNGSFVLELIDSLLCALRVKAGSVRMRWWRTSDRVRKSS